MATCRLCIYFLLKCLYHTKESIVIFVSMMIGIFAMATSLSMVFWYIPNIAYYTDSSRLDLPQATRSQQTKLIYIMYFHWMNNAFFSVFLLTLTKKQKRFAICLFNCLLCKCLRRSGNSRVPLGAQAIPNQSTLASIPDHQGIGN